MNVQWEDWKKEFLRNNCNVLTDQEVAKKVGKSIDSVRKMRQSMDLIKKPGRGVCELKNPIDAEAKMQDNKRGS